MPNYFLLEGAYSEKSLFDSPSQYEGMRRPRIASYIDNNECNTFLGPPMSETAPTYPLLIDYPHYVPPSHLVIPNKL